MKVGELSAINERAMSPRTKIKLEENFRLITSRLGDDAPEDITSMIYSALRWTADDVLTQAIEDGYVSTQHGVL
jgi:hypothetical protein